MDINKGDVIKLESGATVAVFEEYVDSVTAGCIVLQGDDNKEPFKGRGARRKGECVQVLYDELEDGEKITVS